MALFDTSQTPQQAEPTPATGGNPAMVKVYQDFIAENATDLPPMKTPDGEDGGEFDGI